MIKDFMDDTFRKNFMRGRNRESPMDQREMLDEARTVMIKNGHDGLVSSIGVEPYSGGFGKLPSPINSSQGNAKAANSNQAMARGDARTKNLAQMTTKEKVDLCCRGYNSAAGCSRTSCRYKHQCSAMGTNG